METKVQKRYIDQGFGFPVMLLGWEFVKVRGQWIPKVDYNLLAHEVLRALAECPGRLTGNQVRFVRLQFEMTLKQFASRFDVSHPAVIKWEKAGDEPTPMSWTTEKDLRLFIRQQLEEPAKDFLRLYVQLSEVAPTKPAKVSLEYDKLAA